eukprot:29312-Rhodomonas_salina.1
MVVHTLAIEGTSCWERRQVAVVTQPLTLQGTIAWRRVLGSWRAGSKRPAVMVVVQTRRHDRKSRGRG